MFLKISLISLRSAELTDLTEMASLLGARQLRRTFRIENTVSEHRLRKYPFT